MTDFIRKAQHVLRLDTLNKRDEISWMAANAARDTRQCGELAEIVQRRTRCG